MPRIEYRDPRPTPAAEAVYLRWIKHLDDSFSRHCRADVRAELVRDELHQLFLGRAHGGKINTTLLSELPFNVLELSLHPMNSTLEPEYYGDVDEKQYLPRKPLIWFWQMFDRSPVALNHWLGFRFRAMLGRHIFRSIGKNVKIFHGVEFTFGYNLTIEDDCTIHKYVMLDDRGELVIRKGASISDYANVYSHTHDVREQANVTNKRTEIGQGARLTYHSTVLAGVKVGEDAMLGTMGVATKDLEPHTVSGGVPAKEIKKKDDGKDQAAGGQAGERPAEQDKPQALEREPRPEGAYAPCDDEEGGEKNREQKGEEQKNDGK